MFSRGLVCIPVVIAMLALCSGCAAPLLSSAAGTSASAAESGATSGIVQNPSFFDYQARSTKLNFLSPAALLADNPSEYSIIIGAQCYFHTPDPIFLVPDQTRQTKVDVCRLS